MKEKLFYKLPILSFLILISCTPKTFDNPDYEIYSRILSTFKAKTLVVEELTAPLDLRFEYKNISTRMPLLEEETHQDFNYKFSIIDTLQNTFNTKKKIILISQGELHEIFTDSDVYGWNNFYRHYPRTQGLTSFSRIGYNKTKTQALVYYWTQTFELAGAGYYVLYVRKHNRWALKYFEIVGIS
jgi:hypothetical protein